MPRQIAASVQNNFTRGLITEASGLNFPENACTDTYNCVFNLDGSVTRRLGFDYETEYASKQIDKAGLAISTYLWRAAAGDGSLTLWVVQVGGTLYFYDATGTSLSGGALSSTVALSDHLASGAPSPNEIECQFSGGDKYLIVTHPYCEPFYVSYNSSSETVSGTSITIKIRDVDGDSADSYDVDERPTASLSGLNVHHHYNLLNQGWNSTNLTSWDSAFTTMPSNADIMWSFKNSSDAFDTATVANVMRGNTPAPKGHYILTAWDQDRDTASGLSGTTATTSSYYRPTTSAWFVGRVFYAGVPYTGFSASIYFTQIIERDTQYGLCYQSNDPTAESAFDLLASDGGVIRIPEAGTIVKLVSIAGSLLVFATNGIWAISGSTGLGFAANDYTVQKISTVHSISPSSFVDVAGMPSWWNSEGIYIMAQENGALVPKSMTLTTIKSFYDDIPQTAKLHARGFYNAVDGIIQWVYKSVDADNTEDLYEFDRALTFTVSTGSFAPHTIDISNVTINGIVILDTNFGTLQSYDIVDDSGDLIIDDSSNQIIAYAYNNLSGGRLPSFKYLVSYTATNNYFTVAEQLDETYKDWITFDATGVDFTSYFVSGYQVHGGGDRKFNPIWLTVFSNTTGDVSYTFRAIRDYALSGASTGHWSTTQTVTHTDNNYAVTARRLKVRGAGKVLQYKVSSVTGSNFDIAGWAAFEGANGFP